MQSQTVSQSLSTGPGPTIGPLQPTGQTSPLYSLFRSINSLPLKRFIVCAVRGKLKALIISGDVPEDALQDTWLDIQQQYAEALGDTETSLTLNLYKQIVKLATTLSQVHRCLDVLENVYVKQFADALNELLSTSFPFDVTKPDAYDANLKSCLTRSMNLELNMELKSASYEAMKGKSEGKPLTEEYFQDMLITLSDHAKYAVTDEITVYQYTQRITRLNRYIEQLSSKKK